MHGQPQHYQPALGKQDDPCAWVSVVLAMSLARIRHASDVLIPYQAQTVCQTLDCFSDFRCYADQYMKASAPAPSKPSGLRRIAEELGVSVSLASKVLSGRMGTSGATPEMAKAIRQKAEELHYRKNLAAEALCTGRQNVIAVCLHHHGVEGSTIVDEMVNGIATEAANHRQRLLIHYYSNAKEFRDFSPEVDNSSFDGLIVGGLSHEELAVDLLAMQSRSVPIVTILDDPLAGRLTNVGMDQREVTRMSTLHLIDQGCKAIAHIATAQKRYEGFRLALQERGLPFRKDLVVEVRDFGYGAGEKAMEVLVKQGKPFDGLVAQSDAQAAAVLNRLILMGRRVPQDTRVIGVDNAPVCQYSMVPLSSVSQEYVARGGQAVRLLVRQIQGEATSSSEVMPVLYARASTKGVSR